MNYLTYSYLLTPLHTGASSQAGNMMGIAREVQTKLPYLPSSSLRGKIRSTLEAMQPDVAGSFFGERLKDSQQPTEGEVWFSDATLLLFPIASYSHQFVWITCPLWLGRWNRWLKNEALSQELETWKQCLEKNADEDGKSAITTINGDRLFLQGAILNAADFQKLPTESPIFECLKQLPDGDGILDVQNKLVILSNDDCAGLVEIGLQREVRVALKEDEKTVAGGSFRSEEAIPSETLMFFPWGIKLNKSEDKTQVVRDSLQQVLNDRLQFGGLEGLGRGWTSNVTIDLDQSNGNKG